MGQCKKVEKVLPGTHLLDLQYVDRASQSSALDVWQGRKDSNPRMPESKSGALTNLATPLRRSLAEASHPYLSQEIHPNKG